MLVGLLLAAMLPESPRFLLRLPERHESLRLLLRRFGHSIAPDAVLVEDASGRKLSVPIAQLFQDGLTRDTLALWAAFFVCLLSTYSMQSWAPTAYQAEGIALPQVGAVMAGFGFGGILGSLAAGAIIERIGSRSTIAIFAGETMAVAILLALTHPALPLLIAASALLGFGLSGIQSPLYALAAHIYTPQCRATGVGMASAVGRLGAMTSSFTGVMTIDMGGTPWFFLFIALVAGLSFLAVTPIRRHII